MDETKMDYDSKTENKIKVGIVISFVNYIYLGRE